MAGLGSTKGETQWTFSELSVNFQWTFSELSVRGRIRGEAAEAISASPIHGRDRLKDG